MTEDNPSRPQAAMARKQIFTYIHRSQDRKPRTVNLPNGQTITVGPNRGPKVGLMLAKKVTQEDGTTKVVVGWSLCNRKLDRWNTTQAFDLAADRIDGRAERVSTPQTIAKYLAAFMDRCRTYYKTENVECPDPVALPVKKKRGHPKVKVTKTAKKVSQRKTTAGKGAK